MPDAIGAHQMRTMHAIGLKLGMGHAEVGDFGRKVTGREFPSMRDMTTDEKWAVIDALKAQELAAQAEVDS